MIFPAVTPFDSKRRPVLLGPAAPCRGNLATLQEAMSLGTSWGVPKVDPKNHGGIGFNNRSWSKADDLGLHMKFIVTQEAFWYVLVGILWLNMVIDVYRPK